MITLLIISTVAIIILAFIVSNLYNQVNQLEGLIQKSDQEIADNNVELINYYQYFLTIFVEALNEMKRVDKKGSFSSDDEVGFSFKVLITSIQNVTQKLKDLNIE